MGCRVYACMCPDTNGDSDQGRPYWYWLPGISLKKQLLAENTQVFYTHETIGRWQCPDKYFFVKRIGLLLKTKLLPRGNLIVWLEALTDKIKSIKLQDLLEMTRRQSADMTDHLRAVSAAHFLLQVDNHVR